MTAPVRCTNPMTRAWAKGSTRRWRQLRTTVINRDRSPDGHHYCTNCGTQVHHRCTPRGCLTCLHIHHLDGHPPHAIDQVHPNRLALWCAGCNHTIKPQYNKPQYNKPQTTRDSYTRVYQMTGRKTV